MRNKKGFTLVELIVVIALLSILGVGLGVYLNTTLTTYNDSHKYNDLQNRCDVIADRMSEQFRYYDKELKLDDTSTSNRKSILTVNSKIVEIKNDVTTLLHEDLLDGLDHNQILFAYDSSNSNLYITLRLAEDAEETPFEYRFTVHMLNKPNVLCGNGVCDGVTSYPVLIYK